MTREKAIFVLESVITHNSLVYEAKQKALEALKSAPIKHGRWIKITQDHVDIAQYMCSCCGRKVRAHIDLDPVCAFPYCHCGAKMSTDGKDEVEE